MNGDTARIIIHTIMNVSCVNTIYIALLGEGEHYTQIIHTGTIAVGLLHTPRGWGLLASSLGGEVLTRSLSSGGFASGLLGTGHGSGCGVEFVVVVVMFFVCDRCSDGHFYLPGTYQFLRVGRPANSTKLPAS